MAEDSEETGRTRQNLALYRKYRPATFAEVRGQDHVTEPLRQALRSGRINHAYLFSGPRGCVTWSWPRTSANVAGRYLRYRARFWVVPCVAGVASESSAMTSSSQAKPAVYPGIRGTG